MKEKILDTIGDNFLLVIYMVVYLAAWAYNAYAAKRVFDLEGLYVLGYIVTGQHGINSALNSRFGYGMYNQYGQYNINNQKGSTSQNDNLRS